MINKACHFANYLAHFRQHYLAYLGRSRVLRKPVAIALPSAIQLCNAESLAAEKP
jgi:hypothetical protein